LKIHVRDKSTKFRIEHTRAYFIDALKEEVYLVGNYDDLYMRWTNFLEERDEKVPKYTNIFHTLFKFGC
jgi:hypothetical protein